MEKAAEIRKTTISWRKLTIRDCDKVGVDSLAGVREIFKAHLEKTMEQKTVGREIFTFSK